MKGDLSLFLYLALFVIIGLVLIIVVSSKFSPLDSPQGRAKELAMVVSLHIDSLSSVQEGTLKLDTGNNKYDVEIQRWSGTTRAIGSYFSSEVNPNGNYVVVTPYDINGNKLEKQAGIFMINSYSTDTDYYTKVEKTSTICLEKKADSSLAKLVKC